jgi:GntR family transcriptional regulator/MocR family aminotransferase
LLPRNSASARECGINLDGNISLYDLRAQECRLKSSIVELDGEGALYEQLARALKAAILGGRFAAGARLPATRTLSTTLGISRNTVLSAYELLCVEQIAVTEPGSGTRVASTVTMTPDGAPVESAAPSRYAARGRQLGPVTLARIRSYPNLRYNLQYGDPIMSVGLFQSWRRKLAAAALRAGPGYPSPAGFLPLREAVADYLSRRRGVACSPENVLIVGGTQQALCLVARTVLDEGDTAVIEDPHYQMAYHTLLAHGAKVISTRVDCDGLVTSELPARGARLIYVTPSHQFPSGQVTSFERRVAILNYAAKHKSWIFEDDYDSEFRYSGKPLPALRSLELADRVIYVGSFSKTLFPSLRLAYMVCPAPLRNDLLQAKRLADLGCAVIEQAALATFMQGRQFEKHLRRTGAELRRRREALIKGLQKHAGSRIVIVDSHAGMHLTVGFPRLSYAHLEKLIQTAFAHGLGLHPIHPYYHVRPTMPGLLVGFAGVSVVQIEKATEIFGHCLHEILEQGRSG